MMQFLNKSLATEKPLVASLWHPFLNGNVLPSQVSVSTHNKYWWLGKCGHSWDNSIAKQVVSKGCPYCLNKRILIGFNDLATTHPSVAKQIHPTKNGDISGKTITAGSGKKLIWIGDCGHEWESTVRARAQKNAGCLYCSNQKTLIGFNDIFTTHPALAAQIHPTRNGDISQLQAGSRRMIVWLCDVCDNDWEATPDVRSTRGYNCPHCSGRSPITGETDLLSLNPDWLAEWDYEKNSKHPEELKLYSHYIASWKCKKGHSWETAVYNRAAGKQCSFCNTTTKPEQEIQEFLSKLGIKTIMHSRSYLDNSQEIDIYIPEKKFGIEFNGLYWHSEEQGKDRKYHQTKYLAAKKVGIQLIQIWEDDWRNHKNVILRALAHKLGLTEKLAELHPHLEAQTGKVFARKTTLVNVQINQAEQFLESNHIQGFASGSYYLGLQDEQQIIRAVLVLKKEPGTQGRTLNIIRYATSGTVVGGFTKLLKHAVRTYQADDFITFADHCISDGGLYENNGFVADKELPPDYMYVVKGERKHKFGYRLKRFRDDHELLWDQNMSERQLAQLNNIPRVWDAGKTRYRLNIAKPDRIISNRNGR